MLTRFWLFFCRLFACRIAPALLFLLAGQSLASIWYVSLDGDHTDGMSWETAFTSLSAALGQAVSGDEIRIAGAERGEFEVSSEISWHDMSDVLIQGGWEGEGEPGANDPARWPTIIRHVGGVAARILNVQTVTGTLSQVTIADGFLNVTPMRGAGMLIADSELIIENCSFVSNICLNTSQSQEYSGGGIYASGSSFLITNCFFEGNSANSGYRRSVIRGGALCLLDSDAEITDSKFVGNTAQGVGSGLYGETNQEKIFGGAICSITNQLHSVPELVIRNTIFSYNKAQLVTGVALGGAIYKSGGQLSLHNVAFYRNTSYSTTYGTQLEGSAEWAIGGSAVFVQDGSLWAGNCDVLYHPGDGFRLWNQTAAGVSNSLFWGNEIDLAGFPCVGDNEYPNVSYCNIQSGQNEGFANCFSEEPMLERGFYRAAESPCTDAGGALASYLGLDSRTTLASGAPDSGAVDIGYHFFGGFDWTRADFYVSEDGNDSNLGASWLTAFRTITKALSEAIDGTYIHIAQGTYSTNRYDIGEWETFPLVLNRSDLRLIGAGEDSIIDAFDATQRVMTVSEAADIRISGLTIKNVAIHFMPAIERLGGAMLISNAAVTVDGCFILSNYFFTVGNQSAGTMAGPGIAVLGTSSLMLTNSLLAHNKMQSTYRSTTLQGGGLALLGNAARCRIDDSVFWNNNLFAWGTAVGAYDDKVYGGAVYSEVPLSVYNSTFASNRVEVNYSIAHGGAIYAATNLHLANSVVALNRGMVLPDGYHPYGAGVYHGQGSLFFSNVTVACNDGHGAYTMSTGPVAVVNSIFWDNLSDLENFPATSQGRMPNVKYCDIKSGINLGEQGCISVDPLFVNTTNGDFHLSSTMGRWDGTNWVCDSVNSPCLDVGDPEADYAQEPLPNGERINLGAYGNTWQASKTFAYSGLRVTVLTNSVMRGKRATPQFYDLGVTNSNGRRVVINASPGSEWVLPQPDSAVVTGDDEQASFTNKYISEHLPPGINTGYALIEAWDEGTGLFCSNSPSAVVVLMKVMEIARSESLVSLYSLAGHSPANKPFQVWNAGVGEMRYTITTDVPWMQVQPDAGVSVSASDPQAHEIIFDAANLGAGGLYAGQILITVTNAGGAVSVIQVEIRVDDAPEMGLSTTFLTNDVTMGFGSTSEFSVRRVAGEVPLVWSCEVIEGADWLSVNPAGGVSTGEWTRAGVIFSPSISPGFNRGRIRVSGMAAGYGNPAVSSPQTIEVMANGIEKPFLIVIPTAMTNRVLQGFNAPNLSMGILNATKSGRLRFLIQDNVSWVEPMPASGTLGGNLTETSVSLQFATENLAPGRHAATMTVMAEDAVHGGPVQGSPVTIDVLLDVTPLAVLGLDHISLSQYARQGATPASQSFKICNASPAPKGTLAFELEVESTWVDEEEHPPRQAASAPLPPWLSVSPSSGMSDGEWVEATVSYDTTGLAPGLYHGRIQVTGRDVVGQRDAMNSPLEVIASLRVLRPTPGDITGDICGELVLYSANAGSWYVYNLASGAVSFGELFGGPDYEPLLGDFDGDGRADLCVYRGITAGWYARQVGHERLLVATSFGAPGFVPVTSDFDGDGIADIGVYDPSTGLWYIIRIDGRLLAWSYAWGGPGYKPVVADFDGDARCDLAVYHEETGRWYATGLFSGLIDWNVPWGGPGLIGMAGDFDADGRDDLVVYQESSGNWYVWSILKGVLIWGINWGGPGFTPVLGDFDGDGVADIAVYHEHTGTWYGRTVSGELLFWGLPWGGPGMQPL